MKQKYLALAAFALLGLLSWLHPTSAASAPIAPAAAKPHIIPPPGKELAEQDRAELETRVAALGADLDSLRNQVPDDPKLLTLLPALWPDVQIYFNAVYYALEYNEFYDPAKDVAHARALLATGFERAKQLRSGQAPWITTGGARGYISRIDGSVQPYWVTMPANYSPNTPNRYRLDFFYHGRGENLTELSFLSGPSALCVGTATDRFVVHPYGRYCNANKFAGEIDTLEILDAMKKAYPIDDDRVSVAGFSMGGGACWNFAVHYTDRWAAASPGAGFAESAQFLHLAEHGELDAVPWYQKKLWHLYDCTDYAVNLAQLPTISYAGELDGQKQAGDVMEKAMAAEGLTLQRVVGPKTKHAYEKGAKVELDKEFDALVSKGRNSLPPEVRFTTWTLRYNQMDWVTVDALDKHWERARVDAKIADSNSLVLQTQNVAAVTLTFAAGHVPFAAGAAPKITLDHTTLEGPPMQPGKDWTASFTQTGGEWKPAAGSDLSLHKRHGLQGPIDDAFLDRFIFVRPSWKAADEKTGAWCAAECDRAISRWRSMFRGEPRVKQDVTITDADIANSNLILWGDPASNCVIARVADKLPIRWDGQKITLGARQFPADHHVPILIYPNPLNPARYIVLNSGFTFREDADANNAQQVPKLPDYAIIDVSIPPSPSAPGGIAAAGFFGEKWQLQDDDGRPKP